MKRNRSKQICTFCTQHAGAAESTSCLAHSAHATASLLAHASCNILQHLDGVGCVSGFRVRPKIGAVTWMYACAEHLTSMGDRMPLEAGRGQPAKRQRLAGQGAAVRLPGPAGQHARKRQQGAA